MRNTTLRILGFLALAALLAVFAGCKAESSPTAPPVGNGGTGGAGNPPSGGVTPPTGATVTLSVSNANPLVDSVSTITATVTQNGQPVPNGTAVEFITNLGVFVDTQDVRTIRTTTNGVASAVLTSPDPGPATVSATVNNVTRTTTVTFNEPPVNPPQPSTAPTITNVSPNTGPPSGGTVITITGTNFRAPARVLIDAGPAGTKEAFVQSVTPTQIVAVVQGINLASTQTQAASVTVIVGAGEPNEQRVTRAAAFTFVTTNLAPVIRAFSPTSGPIEGGTRVTIIGDAFEQPLQVFFGSAQAQVISVNFNQVIVTSPTARDTAPNGSGAVTGPVSIRVLNVNSGKSATAADPFRYTPKMQITLAGPNEGPFTGGTRFTIDGTGFNEPLTVVTAGVAAQVIKVTGTQIIAISNPVQPTSCADIVGTIVVTNGDNGDTATGPPWIYRVLKPAILSVSPSNTLGGNALITVANATDPSRILIGGKAAQITAVTHNANGTTTYTVTVPTTLQLATQACQTGATSSPIPTSFDVIYTSILTTCTDTFPGGATVNPPNGPVLTLAPTGFTIFNSTITPGNPSATPPTPTTVTPSAAQTVNIVNTGNTAGGTSPLTITSVTTSGSCGNFALVLPANGTTLNQCEAAPIVARYNGQTAPASESCTINLVTNAGTRTINLTGVSQ